MKEPKPVIVVTGMSGAGSTTVLNALEDSGLHCIDNLPMEMLETTVEFILSGRLSNEHGFAFCMNVRDHAFASTFETLKQKLATRIKLNVIFVAASVPVISTRYSATRRRHPLLQLGETLTEAIQREKKLLQPIKEASDTVFDTTDWSPHVLARTVELYFSSHLPPRQLHLTITSFGFKYGQFRPCDTMFDVRFINNPYFVPELKAKTGLDEAVSSFVLAQPNADAMFHHLEALLRFSLPLYQAEGKHYFRVGIGCSGGRHRSVTFAEALGRSFFENSVDNVITTILHRDLEQ